MKKPTSPYISACLVMALLLTGFAEPAWAVENPKRVLMIFPVITLVILVIIIFVTRRR
ncbi:MAG: hypothetical protein P1U64_15360 [Alcanivoracaceae bacterium]|jgi:hypothetical protein|nr:hypothetical protein [Alcanivoracaceae bacterium]